MVDRRRLPDGLQRPGGKLPDHLADPERPIVVQQTTTGIGNVTASTSCVLSCSTMQLVCHTGCARKSPSQQRLPGPRLGAERVQARAAIVASIGSSAVSVAALPAAIASSARWKSSQPSAFGLIALEAKSVGLASFDNSAIALCRPVSHYCEGVAVRTGALERIGLVAWCAGILASIGLTVWLGFADVGNAVASVGWGMPFVALTRVATISVAGVGWWLLLPASGRFKLRSALLLRFHSRRGQHASSADAGWRGRGGRAAVNILGRTKFSCDGGHHY